MRLHQIAGAYSQGIRWVMQRSVEGPRRGIYFPCTCQLCCDIVEVPGEVPALGAAGRGLSGSG